MSPFCPEVNAPTQRGDYSYFVARVFRGWLPLLFLLLAFSELRAQVGNDNPTGPSGMFNGNVTTGCSYDPYTGNAMRSVTDMVVAGAVGQYGLSYSRTWNSRTPGWRSSYGWGIEDINIPTGQTPTYIVHFPDGRQESFSYTASDVDYRAASGVHDRLQPWTTGNGTTGYCYLVLPDGGKIEFYGTRTFYYDPELIPPNWYDYTFVTTALIDPYGQRTTFSYDGSGRLSRITEPAGRWIQLFYTTVLGTSVIDYIQGSDGRVVNYTYSTTPVAGSTIAYPLLTSALYPADPGNPTATYTYIKPNVGSANGPPLLASCDDFMYAGPMTKLLYTYAVANNPDNTPAVY